MKQKIVIQMDLGCEKARRKAMKIAVATTSGELDMCAVEGSKRDQLVVVGEGVNASCLLCALRRKFGSSATILSFEEVKKKTTKDDNRVYGGYVGCPNPIPIPQPQAPVVFYGIPADPPPSCIVM